MNKLFVWGSVLVSLVSPLNVFALPKIKITKITPAVTRTKQLPLQALKEGKVCYVRPQMRKTTTNAKRAAILRKKVRPASRKGAKNMAPLVERKVMQSSERTYPWKNAKCVVYDNMDNLVRDVVAFYGDEGGQLIKGNEGEELMRYELPQDVRFFRYNASDKVAVRLHIKSIVYNLATGKYGMIQAIKGGSSYPVIVYPW